MPIRSTGEPMESRVFDVRLAEMKVEDMRARLRQSSLGPGDVMWGAPLHYRTAMRELYLLLDSCWSVGEPVADAARELEGLLREETMYADIHSHEGGPQSGLLEVWKGQRSALTADLNTHLSDGELWRYTALGAQNAYTDHDARENAELAATVRASYDKGLLRDDLR